MSEAEYRTHFCPICGKEEECANSSSFTEHHACSNGHSWWEEAGKVELYDNVIRDYVSSTPENIKRLAGS